MLKGGFKRLRTTLKGSNKELDELNGLLDRMEGEINQSESYSSFEVSNEYEKSISLSFEDSILYVT